ncbi:MAG TPA: alpha-L-fucosidase [Microbacteriaceae bacterium]
MIPHAPWFTESRLGMFIHWGLYALPARHEWVMSREQIPSSEYEKYFRHFDPDLCEPRQWARAAKDAGMKYVVLTTKHHEGFCLWDSTLTDYKSTNTPIGKDLVAEYVEALREQNLKVGFYYSLIDWHHPDFSIDGLHPDRDDPRTAQLNADRDIGKYREYLHAQVRELLTNYGQIDYLFFDFSYDDQVVWGGKGSDVWGSDDLLAMIRKLQPGIIVNDRLGAPGDFVTPEQYQPSGPLVTIFLFQFVDIWNNYLLPAMVLGDDHMQPVTVGLVGWNASHVAVPPPLVVIGSLVSVVPLIVAFLALQRFWRAGMTAGAVK